MQPRLIGQARDALNRPTDSPLPKDAGAILSLASPLNGLASPGLKPWHVKASYETFDREGKSDGRGTFETFWAGPRKYKQVFTSAAFTQTEYRTETGTYRTGNRLSVPYPQAFLVEQLLRPMPSQEDIDEASPERREQAFGKVQLQCVMLSQKIVRVAYAPLGLFPTYCFAPDKPLLRFSTFGGGIGVIFNQIVLFQGRYFAKQIAVKDKSLPMIVIQVEEVGGLASGDDALFTPPADAVNADDRPTDVAPGVMQGNLLKKVTPNYPEAARGNRVTGTVQLGALIGRDGRIHRLKILRSPDPSLTVAALGAVQQWEYKPYTLNGNPVEVSTTIQVIFSLGG
jgi:TonB family protein